MKLALILAICLPCVAGFGRVAAREARPQTAGDTSGRKPLGGNSIYQLNSRWTDQDGKSTTLGRFQGKPLVLAMIYTSCKDACPMIVVDMQNIEKALPERIREQVGFALISFDPAQDTPAQLKRFGSAHGLDTKRWTLLTGSADAVRVLAAVLGVRYTKVSNVDFAHSSVITILDSGGEIRHQQTGLRKDPGEVTAVITSLLHSAK